jgi:hypothetical protein
MSARDLGSQHFDNMSVTLFVAPHNLWCSANAIGVRFGVPSTTETQRERYIRRLKEADDARARAAKSSNASARESFLRLATFWTALAEEDLNGLRLAQARVADPDVSPRPAGF